MPVPCEGKLKEFRERWHDFGDSEYLRQMLERHARDVPAIAREAGVDKTYIYRLMRKHGL
jgi:DNA-binding phage protein